MSSTGNTRSNGKDPTPDHWTPISGKCNARKPDKSGLCRNAAGKGTDHVGFGQCSRHGGSTANGRKNGVTLRARGEFGLLVEQCGLELRDRTIEQALGDVIERTGAMALAWFDIVCQLQESAEWSFERVKGPQGSVQRWVEITVEGLVGPNAHGEQRVHVADEQYRKWLAAYLQANKVAADLGLEERRVRVGEQVADRMMRAMDAMLRDLGLDPGDEKVRRVIGRHLRAVGE